MDANPFDQFDASEQGAAPPALPDPSAFSSEDDARNVIQSVVPGATITSQERSAVHNAAVGGVPDSMHLTGQAMDFVLPKGMTAAQVKSQLVAQGYPITEFLDEGNHVHWGWGPKPGKSGANPFDQFDGTATAPPGAGGNAFDQFDATPAKAPAKAAPPAPPDMPNALVALVQGITASGKEVGQTLGVGNGATESPAAHPYEWNDLLHPGSLLAKTAYGLGHSAPSLAGGIVGTVAGAAVPGGGETGATELAGGALGATLGTALQSLGPAYRAELKKTPGDPDGAFDRALKVASIESTASGIGWAAFGYGPFKSVVKDTLLQAFGIQPAISVGQTAAVNVATGHPATSNLGQAYVAGTAGTITPAIGHALATHIIERVVPAQQPPVKPQEPVAPSPATPEPAVAATAQQPPAPSVGRLHADLRQAIGLEAPTAPEANPFDQFGASSAEPPATSALRAATARIDAQAASFRLERERIESEIAARKTPAAAEDVATTPATNVFDQFDAARTEPAAIATSAEPPATSFRTTPTQIANEHRLEVARLESEAAAAAVQHVPPNRAASLEGFPPEEAPQLPPEVLPHELEAATTDVRDAREPLPNLPSLLKSIGQDGGIRTRDANGEPTKEGGEIEALLKDYKNPAFQRRVINNETGKPPDQIRESLQQQGWFGPNADRGPNASVTGSYPGDDIQDMYDMIDREARGDKVYHPESGMDEALHGREGIDEELTRAGVSTSDSTAVAARKLAEWRKSPEYDRLVSGYGRRADRLVESALTESTKAPEEYGYEPGSDVGAEFEEPEGASTHAGGQAVEPRGEGENPQGAQSLQPRGAPPAQGYSTELGAEGLPQTIIPGAEASARQLAASQEASGRGRIAPSSEQVPPGGMFDKPRAEQQSLLQQFASSESGALDVAKIKEHIDEGVHEATELTRSAQMMVSPMTVGDTAFRASAKDFANLKRLSRDRGMLEDKKLAKDFTPDQRRRMWEAADEESVARQKDQPTAGIGLAKLSPEERAAVLDQQAQAQMAWEAAKKAGMVQGEGLPSYVPRMMVEMTDTGAKRLGQSDAARSIPGIGRNVTTSTSQLLHRKYLTTGETEGAASQKFGTAAEVVKDIRTLPLATMRLRDAVAGRVLINKIKELGKIDGDDTVAEGHEPEGGGWFTVDHPAFKTWRPKFTTDKATGKMTAVIDQNGDTVFEKVPIYVRSDFEGPLRAILSQDSGKVYRAAMALKGKAMNNIMFSPLVQLHLLTEIGRALPAAPLKIASLRIFFEGNRAKSDVGVRTEAIEHGLVPISHQGAFQDISSIAEPDNIKPGRSWTAQIVGAIPNWLDKRAGDAVYRTIDKAGDFLHNTLLWDRVGDLQFGLYTTMRDHLTAKGYAPDSAQYLAAHWANRYAGTLPIEAMSTMARKIANLALFSRTYTLGNLGVMKDMFNGLPMDVRAQIERDSGVGEAAKVQSAGRRKAISIIAMDVALFYAANSLAQNAFAYFSGRQNGDDISKGYVDRMKQLGEAAAKNPLAIANPIADLDQLSATSENEIDPATGKPLQRILVGFDKKGTAIYMRNPLGKFAEEMSNWVQAPASTLKSKLSNFAKPTLDVITNDKGFGRHLYDPSDTDLQMASKIAQHYMEAQLPMDQINAAHDLLSGNTKSLDAARIAGRSLGLTFRQGFPGGPDVGLASQVERAHFQKIDAAMPDIMQQIKSGDIQGARTQMKALGIPPRRQLSYIQSAQHPGKKAGYYFNKFASPEERAQMQQLKARAQ